MGPKMQDEKAVRRAPTPSPPRSESEQKNLSDFEEELSRSPSRPVKRRPQQASRSPERVPPTQFEDYEPAGDGSGWYVGSQSRDHMPSASALLRARCCCTSSQVAADKLRIKT
eukprot:s22_g38.t1